MIRRRDALLGLGACAAPRARKPQADPRFKPLAPFYAELRGLEAGAVPSVAVLQIGDSHTANDGFSGRMRELMQERFGDAGRGLLPPAVPFKYYRPAGVTVTAQGWTLASSFDASAAGPFGLTGLRQRADGPASITMEVERPGDLAHVEVEALSQPRGATFALRGEPGGAGATFATRDARRQPVLLTWKGGDATSVTLSTDGPLDLLSCRIGRDARGVTWSNLGTIGATVELLARWDWAIAAAELRRLRPALIVLAFGTNEGFNDATDPLAYAAAYAGAVQRLRAAAPGAALLLAGPADGVRKAESGGCGGGLDVPRNLAPVREAQRRVAEKAGLFFWDWSAAMGGRCAMADWSAQTPPLAAADHVHLLRLGYRKTAEALFAELMEGYAAYAAAAPRPPPPPRRPRPAAAR